MGHFIVIIPPPSFSPSFPPFLSPRQSVAKEKEETQAELKERERLVQMQELTAQQLEEEKRKISDTALYLQQNLEVSNPVPSFRRPIPVLSGWESGL